MFFKDPDASRSIGLIVPPSNTVAEYEISHLLGRNIFVHTARLPYCHEIHLDKRNSIYRNAYVETALRFGSIEMKGIMIACTGAQYKLGPNSDYKLCDSVSKSIGIPTITASVALLNFLNKLTVKKLHLISPYPDWLVEQSISYFSMSGFSISSVNRLRQILHLDTAYQVTSEQIAAILTPYSNIKNAAVIISGTGMISLEVITHIIQTMQVPIISSNLAGAMWMADQCSPHCGSQLLQYLTDINEKFNVNT
ncbi:maleate cis-trans isomerase family protein [Shewanella surugensis]|uniref:Asp/Glu racemase n=1 Tax=Shewanella surugensis TaxID=212020 RepID=A0ABT0LC06_9GAMM|nr:hypothetical protein [Shewanella surugensis]MCL1124731.1 hypothetical protein [Shewanella surugensis]